MKIKTSNRNLIPSLAILATVICSPAFSQDELVVEGDIDAASIEIVADNTDLFTSEEPLKIELSFDIKKFIRTKDEPEYFKAHINIQVSDSVMIDQDIKLKARGFMRRNFCAFPPIMLKFKNKDNKSDQLNGKYKLVTHCKSSARFEDYLLKEYLVYKLYNQVTPYSFRTRLAEVEYIDINDPEKRFSSYGFIIENEDDMADRNQAVVYNHEKLHKGHMDPAEMTRMSLFQFMIGNTDWSITGQHNVKLLKSLTMLTNYAIPVAYDFDYSGFVGTYYSLPAEGLPIENVTERYYFGTCVSEDIINEVIDEFQALQEPFMETISNMEPLSAEVSQQVEKYVANFYKNYRNPKNIIYSINKTCTLY